MAHYAHVDQLTNSIIVLLGMPQLNLNGHQVQIKYPLGWRLLHTRVSEFCTISYPGHTEIVHTIAFRLIIKDEQEHCLLFSYLLLWLCRHS